MSLSCNDRAKKWQMNSEKREDAMKKNENVMSESGTEETTNVYARRNAGKVRWEMANERLRRENQVAWIRMKELILIRPKVKREIE